MDRALKGLMVEIGADTSGLAKALGEVTDKSKNIQTELTKVNKLLKFSPKDTTLLAQKQKLLGDQVKATRDRLQELKSAEKDVQKAVKEGKVSEEQYRAFQREIVETESKLKHYEDELAKVSKGHVAFGQKMQETGEKMKTIGGNIADVGKSLTMKVTAPLAAVGGVAFKASSDFETAFTGVRRVVNGTETDFADLETGIRNMAKQMPQSATEIAGVAEQAGKLGIQKDNILDFTRVMLDLGTSTDLSADQAADALAQLANITGMSQEDFGRMGSSIVDLGNNFATTESKIVDMGLRLAGTSGQVGMSESDMLALATAMSSVGINAEAGGSSMSRVMQKINSAVLSGGDNLNQFASVAGVTADDFAKTWQEKPSEAILAFIKGLDGIKAGGGDVSGALKDMGITSIQEIDTMTRLSGANGVLADALGVSKTAWDDNTALTKEAATANDTTASKLSIAKNNVMDLGISLGDTLAPMIIKAADKIKDLADKFSQLSPKQQENIVKIGLLVAAIGPLLSILGSTIRNIGSVVDVGGKLVRNWDKIKSVGGLLAGGLKATVGFIFSPAGAIVVGIAAVIAIGVALYKNWDKIKEAGGKLGTKLKGDWKQLSEGTKKYFNKIGKSMSGAIDTAKEKIFWAIEKIKGFFNFKWSLPKLKIPHFNITGSFSLNPPKVPKFGIAWRAQGGIFKRPTVLPTMAGMQGFAEPSTGGEAIMPLNKLPAMMADALDRSGSGSTIVVRQMIVREDGDIDKIAQKLDRLQTRRRRGGR